MRLPSGYVVRLDDEGQPAWTKQYGVENGYTSMTSVAIDDAGGTYVTGQSKLTKFSADGTEQWVRSLVYDGAVMSLALAPTGGVYASTGSGIKHYDASGILHDTFTLDDDSTGLAYGNGVFAVTGVQYNPSSNKLDFYVASYAVPEPTTLALFCIGVISLLSYVWKKKRNEHR